MDIRPIFRALPFNPSFNKLKYCRRPGLHNFPDPSRSFPILPDLSE